MFRSDYVKSKSNYLRRHLDLLDSLGWQLRERVYADFLAKCPASLVARASEHRAAKESWFSSKLPCGPHRLMNNVIESAWWSQHIADATCIICVIIFATAMILSFAGMLISLLSAGQPTPWAPVTYVHVANVVTALLLFLFSVGLVRLIISYRAFAMKCKEAEHAALAFAKSRDMPEPQAIKIFYEYALARDIAPMLPTWVYRLRKSHFNRLWSSRAPVEVQD